MHRASQQQTCGVKIGSVQTVVRAVVWGAVILIVDTHGASPRATEVRGEHKVLIAESAAEVAAAEVRQWRTERVHVRDIAIECCRLGITREEPDLDKGVGPE